MTKADGIIKYVGKKIHKVRLGYAGYHIAADCRKSVGGFFLFRDVFFHIFSFFCSSSLFFIL